VAENVRLDLNAINAQLDGQPADAIVQWAADHFSKGLVTTSSFGAQAAVMLHLVSQIVPDAPIICVDTGYLFPETYAFAQQLTDRLKLNIKWYQSPLSPARMEATMGKLWEGEADDLNRYDAIRKVEPMQRALKELGATAWLAGLRSQQTDFRKTLRTVEYQNGIYKVHPILKWSSKEVHEYLKKHDLPYHPLFDQGYASIGDYHSTAQITADGNERDGRFRGLKQECGLHLPATQEESESRDASGL
jgi:phosphoadenosine phosphosulfate reductase